MLTKLPFLSCVIVLLCLLFIGQASAALVAHWRFEEGTGGTAGDATGNGHTGTLLAGNPPAWTTGGAPLGENPGKCLDFDGSGEYVDVPDHSAFNGTTAFTVAAWIKPHFVGGDSYARVIGKGCDTNWGLIRWANGNTITFYVMDSTAAWKGAFGSIDVKTDGKWHHVAGVFDGTNVRLYVDGKPDGSTTTTAGARQTTSAAVGIGMATEWTWQPYDGLIDDVRFYNDAQSNPDIQDWSGIPEPTAICLLGLGALALLRRKGRA